MLSEGDDADSGARGVDGDLPVYDFYAVEAVVGDEEVAVEVCPVDHGGELGGGGDGA